MVQRIIEWLLDSPNPEIDREYGDPVTSDRQASFDDATAEEGAEPGSHPEQIMHV
jgi:hypothetical protein